MNVIKEKLKDYYTSCNELVKEFCKKHDFDFDDVFWIAEEVGTIFSVSDYYIDMQTAIYDLCLDADEGEFMKWYDYCLNVQILDKNIPNLNFKSWVKGCPRISEDELQKLRDDVQMSEHYFLDLLKKENVGHP